MAVSKRLRFGILRRDEYTCRYCHATDVRLTVDHVVPVALGGTDDPTNLVAACADCNAGKTSVRPDDATVADVREDALRYAELTRQAYAVLVEHIGARDEYVEEFEAAWHGQPVPDDWRQTITRWFEMGVPIELVTDATGIALDSTAWFKGHGRFKYMCGVVWNQVRLVGEQVRARLALDGRWLTDSEQTDLRIDAYYEGVAKGTKAGRSDALDQYRTQICAGMTLEMLVDGRLDEISAAPWVGDRDAA